MQTPNNMAIVILAAGNSSRLGSPKQLLPYQNKTLIRHTFTQVANLPECPPIIVITGFIHDEIVHELADLAPHISQNTNWNLGMGASIQFAVNEALKLIPALKGILFLVSDQPFLQTDILAQILNQAQLDRSKIIASQYQDTLGIPVYFPAKYFPQLQQIDPKIGAKKLIHQFIDQVSVIDFELGWMDIDTQEDYKKLLAYNPDR